MDSLNALSNTFSILAIPTLSTSLPSINSQIKNSLLLLRGKIVLDLPSILNYSKAFGIFLEKDSSPNSYIISANSFSEYLWIMSNVFSSHNPLDILSGPSNLNEKPRS